jgi:hypothetical protein
MQLHFWVLNTTRDDRATYRVDLAFWSREARWVEIPARVVTPEHGGTYPARPGPGELFDITATRDLASDPTGVPFLHTAPGRARPWNGQPIEWWIDLERDLLGPDSIHGVRLTLTCVARGDEPICRVQDVKQLWFRVRERGPD